MKPVLFSAIALIVFIIGCQSAKMPEIVSTEGYEVYIGKVDDYTKQDAKFSDARLLGHFAETAELDIGNGRDDNVEDADSIAIIPKQGILIDSVEMLDDNSFLGFSREGSQTGYTIYTSNVDSWENMLGKPDDMYAKADKNSKIYIKLRPGSKDLKIYILS